MPSASSPATAIPTNQDHDVSFDPTPTPPTRSVGTEWLTRLRVRAYLRSRRGRDTVWGHRTDQLTVRRRRAYLRPRHRDTDALPFANVFTAGIWLDGRAEAYPQLVPFSAGPARCPGQNVVLFVTSTCSRKSFRVWNSTCSGRRTSRPANPYPSR